MPVKKNLGGSPDHLLIEGLEIACRVGTTAEERAFPQVLNLTFRIFLPLRRAGEADDLKATVDYAFLVRKVQSELARREFQLVESVAENIADLILAERRVERVEVEVRKKILPGVKWVGVVIARERGG